MSRPILCVDFDGVIHSYSSGWKGEDVVSDAPVKGALQWLWRATEFWDVQIYSSRSKSEAGINAMRLWMARECAREFDMEHPMNNSPFPITFAHEKPAAFLTIDDRAVCFEGMWHELDPYELTQFKPWNKRDFGALGTFSQGEVSEEDEGDLRMGVVWDKDNKIVRVQFGKPVAWLGLPPDQAISLANMLMKHATANRN